MATTRMDKDADVHAPRQVHLAVERSPIDIIKDCVHTIHQASVDIASSNELAHVLLCTQQLITAVQEYEQAQVDKAVVERELSDDNDTVS